MSISFRTPACFVLCAFFTTAGAARAQDAADQDAVVRLGDKDVITKTEFDRALRAITQARMAQARRMGITDPKAVETPISHEEKLKVLDTMVDSKILYMLAREAGVTVTDQEVQEEIDKNKAGLPPSMPFEEFLKRQGITLDEVKNLTRMRLMTQKYSQDKVKDVAVSEEEVQKEYDALKAKGLFDTADIAQILVRVEGNDPAAWEAGKKRIDAAYDRLKKSEDFAAVVKDASDDTKTKDDGGVLKGVMRGMLGPEFDERMFTLPIGQVSEPFKSRVGWHIIKVLARGTATLEGPLKDRLTSSVLKGKQQQVIGKLVSDARSKMRIQISMPPDEPAPALPAPTAPALQGAT